MNWRTRPAEFRTNHEWALDIARKDVERIKQGDEPFEDAVVRMMAANLTKGWSLADQRDEARDLGLMKYSDDLAGEQRPKEPHFKPNPGQPKRCQSMDPYDGGLQCGRKRHEGDQHQFGGIAWQETL